jgi:hypothetical protein
MKPRKGKVTMKQAAGIALSVKRGLELAEGHPEIEDEWREGYTEAEIGARYLPGDSPNVSRNAVHYALRELVGEDEKAMIAQEHGREGSIAGGRKSAARAVAMGTKLWDPANAALVAEGRRKGGRNGGRLAGRKNYLEGKGLAALTPEQMSDNGRRLVISNGFALYDDAVMDTDFGKVTEKEYIISLRVLEGMTWKGIADEVNGMFGAFRPPRRYDTIRTMYNSSWKKGISRGLREGGMGRYAGFL